MTTDTRTEESFDGNPAASPIGWVGSARNTVGNNAVACTDLNGDNSCTNEVQPVANVNDRFDFPFDPTQNASNFKEAAVTNAFFLVNDYHDRTYLLGFTEAAGNFQTNNFGLGGAQNDPVNVDAQDGSCTDNAFFATPPDGSRPRMEMCLFTSNGGPTEDGDFDPSVIYHENSHGLSNRLVGGGSTTCLQGRQSGGMGEGWGDFLGSSFLNNPVVGAYVTGNATRGIRHFPMDQSPFTYNEIKNGTLANVHDVGELWAATLWDIRTAVDAATAEQLVVSGMKLMPCNPSMLNARDAILQADENIYGGAHRCQLWRAFAGRLMGVDAQSPNHNSTSTIEISIFIPVTCLNLVLPPFIFFPACGFSCDFPKTIPDFNPIDPVIVTTQIDIPVIEFDIQRVTVDVDITHPFVGDLVIKVISPTGQTATLSNRQGGSTDNFVVTNLDISASFAAGSPASGRWILLVQDLAALNVGTINSFALHIMPTNNHKPTVSITSPATGSTVSGTITVSANATDADGTVASVRFDLPDGTSVTDTTAPFSTTFATTSVIDGGGQVFRATAADNQGATSTTSVTVTVNNNAGGCLNNTFNATSLPLSIPDNNATGITSNLAITGNGTVASLSLSLNITHTFRGDLVVTLISPSGTQFIVGNRAGGSADNIIISSQSITAFNGQAAAGAWRLKVQDLAAADVGTLNSWSLRIVGNCP